MLHFLFGFLIIFFSSGLFAFEFDRNLGDRALDLRGLVEWSFQQQLLKAPADSIGVQLIENRYANLPRSLLSAPDLRELKFMVQHWRFLTAQYVKEKGGVFDRSERTQPGPKEILPIPPVLGSKFPFHKWTQQKGLSVSSYDFRDGQIEFRGLKLRTGDILFVDANIEGADGLFSSLSDNASLATHLGMVVFIETEGNLFPSVVEIHKFGLRAVPLNVFLSPHFANYLEVYRSKDSGSVGWENSLSRETLKFLSTPHAYDLWGKEDDPRNLTCTTTGLHLLKAVGAAVPKNRSQFRFGKIASNLKILGHKVDEVLLPTDFIRDSNFTMVGVLDHRQWNRSIVHELMVGYMVNRLDSSDLNPESFPLSFRINRWGLTQMEKGTWVGNLFIRLFGFTADNLPRGPKDLMALYEVVEKELRKIDRRLSDPSTCAKLLALGSYSPSNGPFSIHDFEKAVFGKRILDDYFAKINRFFK